MQAYPLIPHAAKPPLAVRAVEARVGNHDPHWLSLRWRIDASAGVVVPPPAGKLRRDGLWQTTCFELFLQPDGEAGYCEFNLSPSEAWNVYDFHAYREGMCERKAARAPVLTMRPGSSFAIFDAAIPRSLLPTEPCAMGLTAVIEETGGHKSYWSIAHPDTDAPDFHHAACFAARLEAPHAP
ncbi:DOMON-like domain-containing protein [Erythrobacter sp. SDW2]|uniref:DOMON-like domain-containing protein n=1 Tax=Erythrobacter sp. SDW2 TaxID=2907154 RepID=UPI001F425D37|nr:DOMON-like domain-containing protein [Erythrobacter sp. SDW2]UIP05813.1 DOMON-like domain-containing protein [Erythrobacter sp. SDW2]